MTIGFTLELNVKNVSDEELENCFEGDVVGRYAGQLNIVESQD